MYALVLLAAFVSFCCQLQIGPRLPIATKSLLSKTKVTNEDRITDCRRNHYQPTKDIASSGNVACVF